MSLVTLKEILKETREKKYAVPAFNFNGYEDAQGMMNSAASDALPHNSHGLYGSCQIYRTETDSRDD